MGMSVHLDIVSAEEQVFSGRAELIVATGILGEIGIKPGHAALLSELKPGKVEVTKLGGAVEYFYISGGFLEVQPDIVTVLADTAIRAKDLDEAEAEKAKLRAEEALHNKQENFDFASAQASLAEAMAQIQLIKKLRSVKQ